MEYRWTHIKNSKFVLILLFGAFLFQVTMLKFIWSIENVSRVFNSLLLLICLLYAVHIIANKSFSRKVWVSYLIPGIFIFGGLTLNIAINTLSNFKLAAQFGSTLPWVVFLLIPFFMKRAEINIVKLWRYSYYIMLTIVVLSLIDYYLIFFLRFSASTLITPNGVFLGGNFSLLHKLSNGEPHFRFYACFAEPGSLAMMLLPFILYAFLYKRYIGMVILLIGFYFTYSLGGYLGLLCIGFLTYFYKAKKKNILFSLISVCLLGVIGYTLLSDNFSEQYENKGKSASVREDNFYNSAINLPKLIYAYPFGMPLSETTEKAERSKLYVGSNFMPMNYIQTGGVLSFIGYILVLIMSVKGALKIYVSKKNSSIEYIVVSCSIFMMVLFLFQRTTIWESSLFSLLYAPVLLEVITKKKVK